MTAILCLDWLTIGGRADIQTNEIFVIVQQDKGTSQFANWSKVYVGGEYFADLLRFPQSKIIPKDSFNLRVSNEFLYNPKLEYYLRKLLTDYVLEHSHIVRIDVALDADTDFLGFNRESYVSMTSSNIWRRVGRSKETIYARQGDAYIVDTVTIGQRSGGVTLCWYNKSLELEQVKDKPYLRALWLKAGFHVERVSRIEVSVNFNAIQVTDTDTAEIRRMKAVEAFDELKLRSIWLQGVSKKMDIAITGMDTNVSRMERVDLCLEKLENTIMLSNFCSASTVDRSGDKLIVNSIRVIIKLSESGELPPVGVLIDIITPLKYVTIFDRFRQVCERRVNDYTLKTKMLAVAASIF